MTKLDGQLVGRRLPVGAEITPGAGTHFRVWAPLRRTVEVISSSGTLPNVTVHVLARLGHVMCVSASFASYCWAGFRRRETFTRGGSGGSRSGGGGAGDVRRGGLGGSAPSTTWSPSPAGGGGSGSGDSPMSPVADDLARRTPLKGAALIKDEVKRLPDAPGVYRMIGDEGEVLYVGKARSLKKRVVQYAQGRFHTQRIAHMVDLTRSMEFVTTRTETDALLLEINLIKQLKPRFNVLLRDDKSFPEIVIRRDHRGRRSSASTAAPTPSRATTSAPSPAPGR